MKTRLNLEYLHTFSAVVQCGGINAAAEYLHLTQPAVSTRIQNLESMLSTKLFLRKGKPVILTKQGELLLRYTDKFLQLANLVERDVISDKAVKGLIRIGASETIVQSWLPKFISKINHHYSGVDVEIVVDISLELQKLLFNNKIDLAFLLGPVSQYSIDNLRLPPLELAWYQSTRNNLSTTQLLKKPVASYARNTKPYRELKNALFERDGPDVRIFPSSSLSACFKLVEEDVCIAALPIANAKEFIKRGVIKPFNRDWVPPPLCFTASYVGEPKNDLVENIANIALEVAQGFLNE